MIFASVCIGEDRVTETLHLLNDLRNIDSSIYLLTDQDINYDFYQFSNVIPIKTTHAWTDFERFISIKKAFLETDAKYVYYVDSDSRFFNCYKEKFNEEKFINLLDTIDFDILSSWTLDPVRLQLEAPNPNENKEIRNYKFGFEPLIHFFKQKDPNCDSLLDTGSPLETVLIFKRSEKMIEYLNDLLEVRQILLQEEEKIDRKIKASACGFAMRMLQNAHNIKIVQNKIVYHFFKGNFLREVFPFNFKIDYNERTY